MSALNNCIRQEYSLFPRIALSNVSVQLLVTSLSDWNSQETSAVYAHVAWAKKHHVANFLTRIVEEYFQSAVNNQVSLPSRRSFLMLCADSIIAHLHLLVDNFELR